MAIVQTVDFSDFVRTFEAYGRKDQYSLEALRRIFDYLEEYSDSIGEPVELDVIGICCEFYEMSYADVAADYRIDVSDCEDEEELRETVLDYIGSETSIAGYDDEIIVFVAF